MVGERLFVHPVSHQTDSVLPLTGVSLLLGAILQFEKSELPNPDRRRLDTAERGEPLGKTWCGLTDSVFSARDLISSQPADIPGHAPRHQLVWFATTITFPFSAPVIEATFACTDVLTQAFNRAHTIGSARPQPSPRMHCVTEGVPGGQRW